MPGEGKERTDRSRGVVFIDMIELNEEEGKSETVERSSAHTTRLKGQRIRDEFLCPITYELFREPVVAWDGHTYEKAAIEKWLLKKDTSPRTGEKMEKQYIWNRNIQKLIEDLIAEGGVGLYTHDETASNRLFYVRSQKSLFMKCLGPPESKWNHQVFQVSVSGCVGGRRVPSSVLKPGMDPVLFLPEDSTVSRVHFEITYDPAGNHYAIRDLGSAGGTFIRIPFGKKKELIPGVILLLGKHQFIVERIEAGDAGVDSAESEANGFAASEADDKLDSNTPTVSRGVVTPRATSVGGPSEAGGMEDIVGDAEDLLEALEMLDANVSEEDRLRREEIIQTKMKRIRAATRAARANTPASAKRRASAGRALPKDEYKDMVLSKNCGLEGSESSDEEDADKDNIAAKNVLVLSCFAPLGSPLIGTSYRVDKHGATLGRKPSNTVSLCSTKDDKISNIDNAVSQEHARIEMDKESGSFFVSDGKSKPSTNGTWYRLSPPQQKSAPHELKPSMEVLIGNVRFQASERMTVTEENIDEADDTSQHRSGPA